MKIIVTPKDLVELALWDNYQSYILRDKKLDLKKFFKENKEFELKEKDALVIQLLKCVSTPNITHKFNEYLTNILTIKSINNGSVLINKNTLNNSLIKFKTKFPPEFVPGIAMKKQMEKAFEYIDNMSKKIAKLEIVNVVDQLNTYEYYQTNQVKKLINFHA
jgi:hypothetical protein